MTAIELIQALRQISVETGSLVCLDCEHEHKCGIHGCAIMRTAADLLDQLTAEPPNEPLTLKELRRMSNTDWVWVVLPQLQPEENCWYRAKKLYDLYSHAHYGETWLAYRRKPDGGGEQ